MTKWEYKDVILSPDLNERHNQFIYLGRSRWELVSVLQADGQTTGYFKRPYVYDDTPRQWSSIEYGPR